MTAFNKAWGLVKAPVFDVDLDDTNFRDKNHDLNQEKDFTMLRNLGNMGVHMWQSEDAAARGTFRDAINDDDITDLLINNFEVGTNNRGQGKAKGYLEQMIEEVNQHYNDKTWGEGYGENHVVNVEESKKDFWNKMVERGVLDGAHETSWIRGNPEGTKKGKFAYRPVEKAQRDKYPFTDHGLPLGPSQYSQKRWDAEQRMGSMKQIRQGSDKINAKTFRILSTGLKNDPVMTAQFPMEGKFGSQLYGSEIPLLNTNFEIEGAAQKKTWREQKRNVHAKIAGEMKIRDIERLMGGEKASDMYDYNVNYNKRGFPTILNEREKPAPHVTYRPFTMDRGNIMINPDGSSGTKEFTFIDPDVNPSFNIDHESNVVVPRGSKIDAFGVTNPLGGVSFPHSTADEIMEMIRNN